MTDVVMPQMGESIVEGTLTKWLKKPGEHVERDEPLFEISTDKVDTEIPSPAAGVLKEVLVEEGKTVAISTVVGRIEEGAGNGASAPAPAPAAAKPPAAAQPPAPAPVAKTPEPAQPQSPFVAESPAEPPAPAAQADGEPQTGALSPLVRKMAREYGIDLRQVKGTGGGGRITKQDLEAYMSAQGARTMAQSGSPAPAASAPAPPAPPAAPQARPVAPTTPAPAAPMPRAEAPRVRVEAMSVMRAKIAEHMIMSKRTSAHVTTVHKTDMTKIAKMRERHKAEFQQRYGYSLTFLPFVIAAAVEGIRAYPIVNASIEGNNIIYHNEINIGIAVALENGLIVPVIRNADEKNVTGLQRSIVDLSTRARSRQLKPDEVQGGTFSITNFGSFGSVFATPVINQPQVAILGVGAVEKTPVVVDDAIAIRSVAYLALTFDHRLIDGAVADQYTGKVKSILENWAEEVL
ncbi:MAG TPA: 2-oxoglutarate dehydrogenase, E2 component, dihydrolipoamide succinyltransferase [Bryobacteraceae bacterium]|jgi:2-oxoglutarate dehydrogenase E2 component (dihydrolipoamide succinyltransferase)|nr:2-oxoglutarate dehydrogenase, E2 component, dihydrolipoamide succinyltransferase [Bryobacteraceae bacterium]